MADGAATFPDAEAPAAGEMACPHCGRPNPRKPGAGAIVDCGHCDRSYAQPRPLPLGSATQRAGNAILARSPTDVSMRLSAVGAAVLTVLFYVAVVTPLAGSYVAELFGARGWVPYVISWLSLWAGVLLVVKARLLAWQRRALALDLLPDEIDVRVTPGNAEPFRAHLQDVAARELPPSQLGPLAAPRSFLVERLDRALERFRMRGSSEDVVEQLMGQAQLDQQAVESSYTMIRVFIWAIPLLGFIGTVVGISAAVAGFSDSVAQAVDLEVMKQSIGTVTTGLGVAFDTTLLALVMSIVIMFPTSLLQKAEEDFLSRVEAYCDERLGRRLQEGGAANESGTRGLQEQIAQLAVHIEALGAKLSR